MQGLLHGRPAVVPYRCAAVPNCIGAVATFHGGGSGHRSAEQPASADLKTNAAYLIAVAKNDDARAPTDKDVLKKALPTLPPPR